MVILHSQVSKRPTRDKAAMPAGTARKQVIQERIRELRENTDFVSTLLESLVGYAIIAADFDGNIISFNEGARQIYGYAPEEVIGKQGIEILFPGEFVEAGELKQIVGELIEKGRFSCEGVNLRKNGESFPARILFTLTRDGNGKPVGFVEIIADLTERQQAEHTLTNSEVKYRRLFEAAQDGILILDADTGQITDINPFLTDMLGYPREELLGKQLWEIGPFKDIEASREAFQKLQSQGYVRYENLPLENKSGQRMSVEFVSNVYSVNSHKVIQCNIRDITERVQAEHALKYSEVKYRRLFEAAQDGILILDADTGRIVDVNPFLTDLLGYPAEELLGKELWEIGPFKDIEASRGAFQELQSQGYVRYENLPLENKSGRQMAVEFVSNVYMVNSNRVIQCNIRDITRRVQAEQAQERLRRQLQAKVSELETFSYGIAHDLRSPLVSIEGFSRLLRDDMLNHDAERVQEDIRLLDTGVRKMHDFLNSTLEYSRAGHLIKRTRDVSFSKIVNEVITEFKEPISSIGATVATAKTFPRVNVDRAMIIQVLANLIQNSINYRDKTVPLKIEIGYRPAEGAAVFFVRDNGLGIDASEAEKVFTLFYRGTADGEGSGIGLTIVKKIIEAHGGKVWVQQGQSGKGTTMCFTLPRQHGKNKDNNHGKD